MTKFIVNVIVKMFTNEKIMELIMKSNVNFNETINKKDMTYCVYEDVHMNNSKVVKLEDATNYLIDLFNQTGQIYSCTRTKLGKLLSIAAFKYARKGNLLFEENIYKYKGCGSVIDGLVAYTNMEAYINFVYKDGIKKVSEDISNPINDNPNLLKDEEARCLIKDVFINFGAYSPSELGQCINTIVEYDNVTKKDDKIDLNRIEALEKDDEKNMEQNNLVSYLFQD